MHMPTEPEYPHYKVGKSTYSDASEAARAFHHQSLGETLDVSVAQEPGVSFEVAGVNVEGQRYLNQLYFQNHPMMTAFKQAYTQVLEQAQLAPEDVAPEGYPKYTVGGRDFNNATSAAKAYHSAPATQREASVMVMQRPGMGFEVAGANLEGTKYLNQLDFQNHAMMTAFKASYAEVVAAQLVVDVPVEASQPVVESIAVAAPVAPQVDRVSFEPPVTAAAAEIPQEGYPRYEVGNQVYPDAKSAAEAFHAIDPADPKATAMVYQSPGMGFELGGVNSRGEKYLNQLEFQSHTMTVDFKQQYAELDAQAQSLKDIETARANGYPHFNVNGEKFFDPKEAAAAFSKIEGIPHVTQVHIVRNAGDGMGIDAGGVGGDGRKFVNNLDFQSNPQLIAFKQAFADIGKEMDGQTIEQPLNGLLSKLHNAEGLKTNLSGKVFEQFSEKTNRRVSDASYG
jgi:hypothetical protein